jgi:hypothetical protein
MMRGFRFQPVQQRHQQGGKRHPQPPYVT